MSRDENGQAALNILKSLAGITALVASLAAAAPARSGEWGSDPSALAKVQGPRASDSKPSVLDDPDLDVDALMKYQAADEFDKGDATPQEKARVWRTLARDVPRFAIEAAENAAEWDRYSAEQSARASLRDTAAAEKASIRWVRIPAGSFMMGSDDDDSRPVHRVTLKAFQLAKTEVTNIQYRACVDSGACTPSGHYKGGDDHPVVNVNWDQAKKFADWAGGRLPSEAEWEYAAKGAGKDYRYPWGMEEATCERAVILGCWSATASVCSKTAGNSAQGLCDMAGNVWEWTQDRYHDSYKGAPIDGSAWERPVGAYRVVRGGSYGNDAGRARAADRSRIEPDYRGGTLGFRLAR